MIDHQPLGKRRRSEGSLLRVKKPQQLVASCWLESAAVKMETQREKEGRMGNGNQKKQMRQKENGEDRRSKETSFISVLMVRQSRYKHSCC